MLQTGTVSSSSAGDLELSMTSSSSQSGSNGSHLSSIEIVNYACSSPARLETVIVTKACSGSSSADSILKKLFEVSNVSHSILLGEKLSVYVP